MITRRKVLVGLGLAAVAPVSPVRAQQTAAKVHRMGFLGSGSATSMAKPYAALMERLRELSYVEGKNLVVDGRWAEGRYERLPGLAAELLRAKSELIVAWGTPATLAAKGATSTLPIVMCNTGDPDSTGIVPSLARPGANITGVANLGGLVVEKQLQMFLQIFPDMRRVAVFRNPDNISHGPQIAGAESAARQLNLQLQLVDVRRIADVEPVFSKLVAAKMSGVLLLADPLYVDQAGLIAEHALKHKLPTVSARSEVADAGILMTYGASTVEQFRLAATYVSKIFRGARPAELPVEQATKFDLVINLKTARALGIKFPESVLFRADRVIE